MENFPASLFPSPPIQISDEEFHAFHLIDRKLYQILIDDLERDPLESMNLMAFWLWLEREVCVKVNLVQTLLEFPHNLINEVADETVICLLCCQHENLPISEAVYELAVLPNLAHPNVAAKKLSLQDFHCNRASVILNVNKMVMEVCFRAFKHLVPKKHSSAGVVFPFPSTQTNISRDRGIEMLETSATKIEGFPKPIYYGFPGHQPFRPPPGGIFVSPIASSPVGVVNAQQVLPNYFPMVHARQLQSPYYNNPNANLLSHISLINREAMYNSVLPEDRTIFITFSKGYPVSEAEVRDFFTRKFGDCVEAIYMQDVPTHQQALYARVVVRSAAIIDMVVQGGRAKYSIFGKHVWARKYVKKNK